MTLGDLLAPHAALFGLTACRIGACVAMSPFPGNHVAVKQRVALVVVLAWIAGTALPTTDVALDGRLVLTVAREILVGLMIGATLRFAMLAADVVGAMFAQATGLAVPSVLNPTIESQDSTANRIVGLLAMLVALAVGAHRVLLASLLESFRVIPPGAGAGWQASAVVLVDAAFGSLAFGVRLSMPLVAVTTVVQLALAIVARTAPSLQIFNLGLTMLVVSGFATFLAGQAELTGGLVQQLDSVGNVLDRVLTALRDGAP
jgi:flagellar biosynthetic protein FliR